MERILIKISIPLLDNMLNCAYTMTNIGQNFKINFDHILVYISRKVTRYIKNERINDVLKSIEVSKIYMVF